MSRFFRVFLRSTMITGVHNTPNHVTHFPPLLTSPSMQAYAQVTPALSARTYFWRCKQCPHVQRMPQPGPAITVLFVASLPQTQIHSFYTHPPGYAQAQTHLCMSKDHPCMRTPVNRGGELRAACPAPPPRPVALCSGDLCWWSLEQLSESVMLNRAELGGGGEEEGPPGLAPELHVAAHTGPT